MRSYDPNDKYDREEAERLQAPAWMLDVLAVNPGYCSWGPHEDYMIAKDAGRRSPVFTATWAAFDLSLDDLNEVANFYFSVQRDSEECMACGGEGYNPETRRIADAFYGRGPGYPERWCDRITQDEVDALVEAGRLVDFTSTFVSGEGWRRDPEKHPTADEVNAWQRGRGLGHDAINRSILVKTRARRLGVWGEDGRCSACKGRGSVFTADAPRLALTLWVLHPRKGASRGWEIGSVEQSELPAAFAFLREAAARNAARFGKVPAPPPANPKDEETR